MNGTIPNGAPAALAGKILISDYVSGNFFAVDPLGKDSIQYLFTIPAPTLLSTEANADGSFTYVDLVKNELGRLNIFPAVRLSLLSVAAEANQIWLQFSNAVTTLELSSQQFTVLVDGSPRRVARIEPTSNASTLLLTMEGQAVNINQSVGLTYNDLTPQDDLTGVVQDLYGQDLATIAAAGFSADTFISAINIFDMPVKWTNLTLTGNARTATGNALPNIIQIRQQSDIDNFIYGGPDRAIDYMDGEGGSDIYLISLSLEHSDAEINDTGTSGTDELRFASTITGQTITVFAGDRGLERITIGTGTDAIANLSAITALNINASAAPNALTIAGNDGANRLTGSAYMDTLIGSAGIDTLVGGAGDDSYIVDTTTDVITEAANAGSDTVASSVSFSLAAIANVENLGLTGTASISGTGNSLNNVITGNSAANNLSGDAGNDSLNGGDGIDTLIGGAGDDTYIVDTTTDVITEAANAGSDTVASSVSFSLAAIANVENLGLTGTAEINGTGNSLNNAITGNAAANNLSGDAGNDSLNGGAGIDTLIGGAGNDTYIVDSNTDVITEEANAGSDTVVSIVSFSLAAIDNVENLTLIGSANIDATGNSLNNVLNGNSSNNSLIGGDGNDSLNGAAGIDTLIGGTGNDTYFVDTTTDVITEEANSGNDAVSSSVSFSLAAIDNVENLSLTGTAEINGTGNSLNNAITGNAAANNLSGDAGNDSLNGGAGIDILIGGDGDDTYIVDTTTDVITEEANAGSDTVASSVSFSLAAIANVENLSLTGATAINGAGNSLNNVITGNSGANNLSGDAGNDSLNGGAGIDTLIGGAGDDTYIMDTTTDVITEAANDGSDTVASSVSFSLAAIANVENLSLTGATAINGTGNSLNNVITGNSAANNLSGNAGNDSLNGGDGIDILIGGAGEDTYIVDTTIDVITEEANAGSDTVASSVSFSLAAIANVENLSLTGIAAINGNGNSLNNTIAGNSGANSIDGGDGIDTLIGGTGDDSYTVDSTTDVITEEANAGSDTVTSSASFSLATIANVENLSLTGIAAINGTGNSLNNVITGNSAANNLSGDAGNDSLNGGDSIDSLIGGAGDDTYIVDSTTDVITEADNAGTDTVVSSVTQSLASIQNVENLTLIGSAAINATGNNLSNVLIGNTGNNILDGGAGIDTMIGGDGDDTYILQSSGSDSALIIEAANAGIDTVVSVFSYSLAALDNVENLTLIGENTTDLAGIGNSLNNLITGTSTNNTLDGGDGIDTLIGGDSDDTYIVDTTSDVITEAANAGSDNVVSSVSFSLATIANVENLSLTGTANTSGTGNSLNNTIAGNSGANNIDGGDGIDTLIGGAGDDTYIVDSTTDVITEADNAGTDTVVSSVTQSLASIQNVENLTLIGSAAINATGNNLSNVLIGNTGNNILDGGAGIDTLIGGDGDDTYILQSSGIDSALIIEAANAGIDTVVSVFSYSLAALDNVENLTLIGDNTTDLAGIGNSLNNLITGTSANNTLDGGDGIDTLIGGDGDDSYIVDTTTDVITEEANAGSDTVVSSFNFSLAGIANVENLSLTGTENLQGVGNSLNNTIAGNSGSNSFMSGDGIDTLIGGDGDDIYIVDTTTDVITEEANAGSDTVASSVSFSLAAIANLENLLLLYLYTGSMAINGTGNSLNNTIAGNSGANSIDGGDGIDTLRGGDGDDTYIVDSTTDEIAEAANAGSGTDTVVSSVSFSLAPIANVENLSLTGTANTSGTGNSLNNTIAGNSGANNIDGGDGIDSLIGGAGDDTYIVDTTTDMITEEANAGSDTVVSSVTQSLASIQNVENLTLIGSATINATGNSLNNVLIGNTGNNILNGGAGIDTLIGGAGNDTYIVDSNTDVITEEANAGTDTVASSVSFSLIAIANVDNLTLTGAAAINGTGNSLNNVLIGNSAANNLSSDAGNDSLNGGAGIDTLIGGAGNDTYIVDSNTDVITEEANAGTDTVASSVSFSLIAIANLENLSLTGSANIDATGNSLNNLLVGNSGHNSLTGGDGNDNLNDGDGIDSLNGGVGNDLYIVDSTTDLITEAAGEGTDTVNASVSFSLAAIANLENLILTGSAGISGTGNSLNNTIAGNSGANSLTGGDGNDTLTGGDGIDSLNGGVGNDLYIVDSTTDLIREAAGEGTDTVNASVSFSLAAIANLENLILTGSAGISGTGNSLNNTIAGNSGANSLTGGDGNDTLIGGDGIDSLNGGVGNDLYFVDSTTDLIREAAGEGTDTVNASVSFSLAVIDNLENLILTGTSAINGTGNSLNNFITGNSTANNLSGDAGNDTLIGGAGNDSLSGGLGADAFRFDSLLNTGTNLDSITDFSIIQGDTIQLSRSIFTAFTTPGTLAASAFVVGTAATNANQRILYNSASGLLSYDSDGIGAIGAIGFATLSSGLALTNASFSII
jgi:Ca2+-binding RTX toxin-like protein